MTKNLVKHGNSWALVLDKPIMELLQFEPETPLDLITNGDVLVVHPRRSPERQKQFQSALNEINRKYSHTLKRLAE